VVYQIGQKNTVTRLDESWVWWRKSHPISDQLQDHLVPVGEAMLADQIGPCLPKRDTPDFTLRMDLPGFRGLERINWTPRHARVWANLSWINIPKGQGVLAQVRAIRVASETEVIVLTKAVSLELESDVCALRVDSVDIVSGCAQA